MAAKKYTDYIIDDCQKVVKIQDYERSPATAFLKCLVSAKDASQQCTLKFKSKSRKKPYSEDALASIYFINGGLLASIMGNFETFQKYLFAEMFDYSVYLNSFNVESFLKKIKEATKANKTTEFEVDFVRFAAFRDNPVAVGMILADQLKNWQSPTVVNLYYNAFGLKNANNQALSFFSNEDKENLAVLWQMRHSIVHTAGTISLPDSQKVKGLESFGGKAISLDNQFIYEVARKMHPLIKNAVARIKECYFHNLKNDISLQTRSKIESVFSVKSSCNVWLR